MGERNFILDLYYTELGRRAEKEIVWAGDGVQIWLQLLLHVFRLRDRAVIVLDEPDVFLHPDLQRRLVRLLESLPGQTITATHSSEVLTEAPFESVAWVDKVRKRSISAPASATLAELTTSLGSHFNIRLARALRAKVVLFVEGDDAKTLRNVASTVGASRVATETGIAVIPLKGFDNWEHVEPFTWMSQELLENSVEVFVLLDRDYKIDEQCQSLRRRLRNAGVHCHVWKRKELESYLLEHAVIERLSGASTEWVNANLADAANELEEYVFAQLAAETLKRFPRDQQTQAVTEARRLFVSVWTENEGQRPWVAPPDRVLRALNRRLTEDGHTPLSFRTLARNMREREVPTEMRLFLLRIEEALDEAGVPAAVR